MVIDWTRPIQFENGERCELEEIWPDGTPNFSNKTHIIRRLDVDTSTMAGAMSSVWWVTEDGLSGSPGYCIVNVPGEFEPKEPIIRRRGDNKYVS